MSRHKVLRTLSVGVLALGVALPAAGAAAAPRPQQEEADGLVKGQGITQAGSASDAKGQVVTLHGVRRVPKGTVVYASSVQRGTGDSALRYFEPSAVGNVNGVAGICQTMVLDTAGGKTYEPLEAPVMGANGLNCFTVPGGDPSAESTPDKGIVVAVVLPELPAELTTVDVALAGIDFQGVAVEEGYMAPLKEGVDTVSLADQGWPEVKQEDVDKAAEKAEKSSRELEFVIEDLKGEQATVVGGETTTVRVKSDILFAVDKYELTEPAKARIKEIAEELKQSADLTKPVKVTGHTDDVNTEAYNQTLSEKRAASVAAELKKHLPAGTVVEEEGKSFNEPIADNSTDEGKAKNRRVEIEVSNK